MERAVGLRILGGVLLLLGCLLSVAPVFTPAPSGPPVFQGTYWYVGVPVAIVGLGFFAAAANRK